MGKKVVIEIESKGGNQVVKSLELITEEIKEQKEITVEFEKELLKLEQQLKNTPKNSLAEQKALKTQITNLKDAIKDQRVSLKDLNIERKDALVASEKLGNVQEDLTDTVTKNGGAMALLNQLTGGLAQQFKDSYEAIAVTNKNLKGFRGALLATGIGAAVLAVGFLATNFDKVKEALLGVTAEQKKFKETQIESNVAAKQASQSLRSLRKVVLDETASQSARRQALMKLGETAKELNDVTLEQEDLLEKVTAATDPYIKAVEARAKAEAFAKIIAEEQANIIREQQKDLSEQISTIDVISSAFKSMGNASKTAANLSNAAIQNQQENVDKSKNLIASLQTQYTEFLQTALDLESKIAGGADEVVRGTVESVNTLTSTGIQSTSDLTIKTTANLDNISTKRKDLSEQELEYQRQAIEWTQMTEDEKLKVYLNGLSDLGTILGEESAAGKAAAIANATIQTYESANASYKSLAGIPIVGPALGAAAAGAAIVSGVANVKKITATKTLGGKSVGGAGAGRGDVPSTTQPPAFNIVGASGTNQLAEAIGDAEKQPVKAYVVSNDVTTAQSMDRNIVDGASI